MAKMACTCVKAKKTMQGPAPQKMKFGDPAPGGFELTDFQDGSFKIRGKTQAQNVVDIPPDVATLTTSSADTSIVTVDPPVEMSDATHGVKKGDTFVIATVTWNDPAAGIGPFTLEIPAHIVDSPVSGLVAEFGVPTVRTTP